MLKRVAAGALLLAVSLVAVGGGWPSPFPLPADHDSGPTAAHAQSAAGEAVEVRVAARRLADGRTEFAFEQRGADGSWGARQLPTRRFFPPDTDVGRWLSSSPITVDLPSGTAEARSLVVRVAAQLLPDGRMEFALQELSDDGTWSDRRLPTRRFFPADARVNQWLYSSPLTVTTVGVEFSPGGGEVPRLATATIEFPVPPASTDGAALVSIEPAIEGSFVWSDDRTLLFQPAFPGWQRGQRYTISVDGSSAGLARDFTHAFTVEGGLEVAYVIPGDGDREVPTEARVLVQFNRSVAALTVLQEGDAPQVLEFDPPLAGKGEWLNTSLYRFIPTDLRPSTTYRVRIPAGLTSAVDGVLGSDFTWSFETIQPAIVSFEPADGTKWVEPDGPFVVTFNQPMDRASVEAGLRLSFTGGGPLPLTFEWNEGDTVVTVAPSTPLELGATYEWAAPGSMASASGGVTSAERTARFTVAQYPRLVRRDASIWGIQLEYNNPMDFESFEGRISITGIDPDDIGVGGYEHRVSVSAPLEYSTSYTVRIAAGVRDRGGRTLPATSFSFTTRAPRPPAQHLNFATPREFTTIAADGPQVLHYYSAQSEAVDFVLYRLTESEADTLLGQGYIDRWSREPFQPSGDPIREWTEPIREDLRDQSRLYSITLRDGGPLPRGDYLLRASSERVEGSGEAPRAVVMLSVVDTAIVTKIADGELRTWALDYESGEPVVGLEVRALGVDHWPLSYQVGTTDPDGVAVTPVEWTGGRTYGEHVVRITSGGRYGVSSTRWDGRGWRGDFGLPYYRAGERGYVYTDRPIYRPGETVFLKGIVRADDDAVYSLPELEDPIYWVTLRDPEYNAIFTSSWSRLNELGSLATQIVLAPEASPGTYTVTLGSTRTGAHLLRRVHGRGVPRAGVRGRGRDGSARLCRRRRGRNGGRRTVLFPRTRQGRGCRVERVRAAHLNPRRGLRRLLVRRLRLLPGRRAPDPVARRR